MQQVLFNIPVLKSVFPPDGFPINGFGAMLFITFILATWWGIVRAKRIGMSGPKFQDFVVLMFIAGFVGARIVYMIQYPHHFPDTALGLFISFFQFQQGGIVFYGSVLGGAIAYGFFYRFVLRKIGVSGWQLADAVAPLLALGLALGRIGCYLNGCCWGQVACEEACPVPLGAAHFPLLPAHARGQLVEERYLQTSTGFATRPRNRANLFEDPRARVTVVEPGSPADKAGLKPGDLVVKVNGERPGDRVPNAIVVDVTGPEDKVKAAIETLRTPPHNGRLVNTPTGRTRVEFDDLPAYLQARRETEEAAQGVHLEATDRLEVLARDWPRGRSRLLLSVERDGRVIDLPPFAPKTVGLYPTQLYETLSMVLLILLLLAYYPYRRHDGQLFVLLMVGYAVHRFINESLRVEPSYTFGLTLSQWVSVVVLTAAVAMETYLWCVMPSRWKREPTPTPTQGQPANQAG